MHSIIVGNSLSELSRKTNEWDNRNAYHSFIVFSIKAFFFPPWSPTKAPYFTWILMFHSEIINLTINFLHLILQDFTEKNDSMWNMSSISLKYYVKVNTVLFISFLCYTYPCETENSYVTWWSYFSVGYDITDKLPPS